MFLKVWLFLRNGLKAENSWQSPCRTLGEGASGTCEGCTDSNAELDHVRFLALH